MDETHRIVIVIPKDQPVRDARAIAAALDDVGDEQTRVERGGRDLGRRWRTMHGSSESLVASLKRQAIRYAAIAAGIGLLARQVLRIGASYESLLVQLQTVEGSQAAANAQFAELRQFATSTPFELDSITKAYVRLRSVGISPTRELMTSIGDTASAFGRDITDFSAAVVSATTGEMESLKAFGIVAKQQGDEVRFSFKGVETVVKKEASAIVGYLEEIGRTDFAGSMVRQSQTLNGQVSTLSDTWKEFVSQLFDGGFGDASKNVVGRLQAITQYLVEAGAARGVIDVLRFVADHLVAIGIAVAAINLAPLIAGVNALTVAVMANPLLAGGAVVLATLVLISDRLAAFSRRAQADIDEITAPSRKLATALDDVEAAIKSGDKALLQSKVNQYTADLIEATRRQKEHKAAIDGWRDNLNLARADTGATAQEIAAMNKRLEEAVRQHGEASAEVKLLDGALSELIKAEESATASAEDLAGGVSDVKSAYADLRAEVERQEEALDLMRELGVSAEDAGRMVSVLLSEGNKATVDQVRELVAQLNEARKQIEDIEAGYERARKAADLKDRIAQLKQAIEERKILNGLIEDGIALVDVDVSPVNIIDPALGKDDAESQKDALKIAREHSKELEAQRELVAEQAAEWYALGDAVAGVLSGMEHGVGNLVGSLLVAVDAFRELAAAQEAGDAKRLAAAQANAAAAGGAVATSAIGTIGSATGFFGGGTSNFGGRLSSDYAQEGFELGSLFGPVGALFGAVIGSFFEKAGDVARVVLEASQDASGRAVAIIERADGGLSEIAQAISGALSDFVSNVQSITGGAIDASLANLSITVEDKIITVRVRGLVQGFRTLDEALSWAAEQVLASQESVEAFGDNVRALFASVGGPDAAGSFEDLSQALGLAQLADDVKAGAIPTEYADSLREIASAHQEGLELARRYGLSFADVIAVTDARIAQVREEIAAQRDSLFGVTDYARQAQQLTQAMVDLGSATEQERARRIAEAAEAEARADTLEAALADGEEDARKFGRTLSEMFRQVSTDGTTLLVDVFGTGIDGIVDDFSAGIRETTEDNLELGRAAERAREEADALAASLENIPESFTAQEMADIWTTAAARAGTDLVNLIRQVRGEQFGAAEAQLFATSQYAIQLALQIQSVETLLAATATLDAVTRGYLQGLVDEGRRLLSEIAAGDITVNVGSPAPPRPVSPPSGSSGVEQRQARRAEIRELIADMERGLDLIGGAAAQVVAWRKETADLADEMERLSVFTDAEIEHMQALRAEREAMIAMGAELDVLGDLARRIGDEETLAEVAKLRQELELANLEAQIHFLFELGSIGEDSYGRMLDMLQQARGILDNPPEPPSDVQPGDKPVPGPPLPDPAIAVRAALDDLARFIPSLAQRLQVEDTLAFFDALNVRLKELGFTEEEIVAFREQAAEQLFLQLGSQLSRYIQDEELLGRLAEIRGRLEIANYRLQLQLLEQLGILAGADLELLKAAIDAIERGFADGAFSPGGGSTAAAAATSGASARPEDPLRELREEAQRFVDAGKQTSGVRSLNNEMQALTDNYQSLLSQMRDAGLATDDLTTSYEAQTAAIRLRATQTARDFLGQYRRNDPTASPGATYADTRSEFLAAVARANAGDLDAVAEAVRLGGILDSLGQQQFGTSTGAYGDLRGLIESSIAGIPGVEEGDRVVAGIGETNTILRDIRDLFGGARVSPEALPPTRLADLANQAIVTRSFAQQRRTPSDVYVPASSAGADLPPTSILVASRRNDPRFGPLPDVNYDRPRLTEQAPEQGEQRADDRNDALLAALTRLTEEVVGLRAQNATLERKIEAVVSGGEHGTRR